MLRTYHYSRWNTPTRSLHLLFLTLVTAGILLLLPIRGQAQLITNSPNLPPPEGVYVTPTQAHQLYNAGLLSIEVININHFGFQPSFAPPQNVSDITTHSFNSTLTGNIIVNGGSPNPFSASAQTSVFVQKVSGPNGSPLGIFQTEMLQLNINGLPGGAMIRESPTLPSLGQTDISDVGGGFYRIDSFFDVFTELSLDGGQTWIPSTGSGHVQLAGRVPEPGTMGMLTFGLLLVTARRRIMRT
jgi:hypothetical protein